MKSIKQWWADRAENKHQIKHAHSKGEVLPAFSSHTPAREDGEDEGRAPGRTISWGWAGDSYWKREVGMCHRIKSLVWGWSQVWWFCSTEVGKALGSGAAKCGSEVAVTGNMLLGFLSKNGWEKYWKQRGWYLGSRSLMLHWSNLVQPTVNHVDDMEGWALSREQNRSHARGTGKADGGHRHHIYPVFSSPNFH